MEALVRLLFTQFISEESSPVLGELFSLRPVVLSSAQRLQPADLQLLQYLIAKNFLAYSPAHLTLRLDPHAVLFFQRVHKLAAFAHAHLHPHFARLLTDFVANDLLPVPLPAAHLRALHSPHSQHEHPKEQPKKAKKKEEGKREEGKREEGAGQGKETIDYTRLVCEYGEEQEEVECVVVLGELTELLRLRRVEEQLGTRSRELLKSLTYQEGEEHLESLSFREMYRITKENRAKAPFIHELIARLKHEHLEDYILQLFRRHDSAEEEGTALSRNVLLVFNLARRLPLLSEKELMEESLLPVVVLRKCLNLLVAEGLLNYYPESARSTLYRITNYAEIEARFVDHLAQALLNLHRAATRELPRQHLLKLECMINSLDDQLLLFGY